MLADLPELGSGRKLRMGQMVKKEKPTEFVPQSIIMLKYRFEESLIYVNNIFNIYGR